MQIISLYEQEKSEEGLLISELEHLHRGNLAFPECQGRPYVLGNFVEMIDGVVSFGIPEALGGGPISGFRDSDRFVMGASAQRLRALSTIATAWPNAPTAISRSGPSFRLQPRQEECAAHRARSDNAEQHAVERWTAGDLLAGDQW
jgi:hypothetical protein